MSENNVKLSKRLLDKKVFISGAGSGIGKAIALRFASEGADIALNDINKENVEKVAEEIKKLGRRAEVIMGDVSEVEDVKRMVDQYYEKFGELDVLINNAGIGSCMSRIISLPEEKWDRILKINLTSVFLMSKYFGKRMIKRKVEENELRGKIINMASMRGKRGRANFGDYCASKFGVIALTQTMAMELGKNKITVNAICPGLIHTPIYGSISYDNLAGTSEPICLSNKPVGLAEDVAGTAFHIASSDCDWVTGQSFPVSGGMHFV